jgi:hypothetical protein
MFIVESKTQVRYKVLVESVSEKDYKFITKARFWFDWKSEKGNRVFKLRRVGDDSILGLVSLTDVPEERRTEISLLAVSKENRGKEKQFDRIAGTLIAFACREAIKLYGEEGCVSLLPKTALKKYYIAKYGMLEAGFQIFLQDKPLLNLLIEYEI